MKAILITYNQALIERVELILNDLRIRGFTRWNDVQGRGTNRGEPHMGTHTWPALNSATFTVVENAQVEELLNKIEELNKNASQQGVRAFVWSVEKTV